MKKASTKKAPARRATSTVRVGSGRSKKSGARFAFNKRLAIGTFVVVFGALGILTILASHADPIGRVQRFLPWGSGVQSPSNLSDYVVDPSGNMWFSSGPYKEIGEYPVGSTASSQPLWIQMPSGYGAAQITSDRSGNIWFTAGLNALGEIPVGTHAPVFYNLGSSHALAGGIAKGNSLIVDPAGNVWFLMFGNPSTDQITVNMVGELPAGTPPSRAASAVRTSNFSGNYKYMGLVSDPSGNIWVNEWSQGGSQFYGLAKIPAGTTKLPTSYDLPIQYHFPTNSMFMANSFTSDNAGNIWLALTAEGTSGRVDYIGEWPAGSAPGSAIKLMSLPTSYVPGTITSDSANNLWVAGTTTNSTGDTWIAKIPAGSTKADLHYYNLPDIGRAWQFWNISTDNRGNVWFFQFGPNEVDEITSVSASNPVAGTPAANSGSQSSGQSQSGGTSASGATSSGSNTGSNSGSNTTAGTSSSSQSGGDSSSSSSTAQPDKAHAVYAKKHHWYDPLLFWHYL